MSIAESVIEALQNKKANEQQYCFAFAQTEEKRPYCVTAQSGELLVQVTVEDFDRLGVLLNGIRIIGPIAENMDECAWRHSSIVDQTDALASPYGKIEIFETDVTRSHSVLRTKPQPLPDGGTAFFEVLVLDAGEIELVHYAVRANCRQREGTPINIGLDSFSQLLEDIVGAATV